ncbi:MAG: TraR/DksA C4-type zinc finger protein [Acidobacteriia bacterium]|nr:TraR/DksA C4-type zinc finger protein [Terriglobia bacterium]
MQQKELERYKALLLAKRRELLNGKAGLEAPVPAAGVLRGDVADQAAAAVEADLQVRLRQTDSRLLRAIDEGLARIDRRTFGACTACGKPITTARLDAVPWTRLCRDCKEGQSS